jgi:ParB-like chromosome segregation protein Spo0J
MTTSTAIPLAAITIGQRIREHPDEGVGELAQSISERGLLHPITVYPLPAGGYELVAGLRRLLAHQALGRDTIPAVVRADLDTPYKRLCVEVEENGKRKAFTPGEAAQAGLRLEAYEVEAAQARRAQGRSLPPGVEGGRALDRVAASVGMSRSTYAQARAVYLDGEPDLRLALSLPGARVSPIFKEHQRREFARVDAPTPDTPPAPAINSPHRPLPAITRDLLCANSDAARHWQRAGTPQERGLALKRYQAARAVELARLGELFSACRGDWTEVAHAITAPEVAA